MGGDKSLVPAIRFKGFSGTWEDVSLEELGTSTSGTSIESEFSKNGKYKVISIGSYSEKSEYTDQGIRAELTKKTQHRVLNKNDLTMILNDKTLAGNIIGRVLLIKENDSFVYNQRTQRIEIYAEKYDNQFIYQLLNAPLIRLKIVKSSQGNTQIYVNWSSIKKLNYTVPRKKEQTKIGNFFQQLDTLITQHQQKHGKLLNLKQSLLEKMFPQQGADEPAIRFKGFDGAWEEKKLGNVIDDLYNGQTPSRIIDDYWKGKINWLSSGELNRSVVTKTIEKITLSGKKSANLRIIPKGIFVMAITGLEAKGTRGNCAILGINTTLNQSCMAIYPNANLLDSKFLFQWYTLRSEEYGMTYTQGTKQQSYNAEIIKKLEIKLPEVEEQKRISALLSELDTLITQHQTQLTKLNNIKQACLAKLFV